MSDHRDKDIEFHAAIADVYDYLTVEPRQVANDRLFRRFDRQVPRGRLMIDLGSGTGHMLRRYSSRFASVIAVDHSAAMLKVARRELGQASELIRFVESDVAAFIDGYHGPAPDFVSAVGFLHHLQPPELDSLLGKIHALLPPGGRLLIAEPIVVDRVPAIVAWINARSLVAERLAEVMPTGAEDPDEEELDGDALLRLLDRVGFDCLRRVRSWDLLHRSWPPGWVERLGFRALLAMLSPREGDVLTVLAERPHRA